VLRRNSIRFNQSPDLEQAGLNSWLKGRTRATYALSISNICGMCPIFSEHCFWDWVSDPRHKIGVVSHPANQRHQRQTWPWCLDRGFKFWQDTQPTSYCLVILNYLMQFGDVWGVTISGCRTDCVAKYLRRSNCKSNSMQSCRCDVIGFGRGTTLR
jgi:hypothetical protein